MLWLWLRLAVIPWIRPPAWELTYASGAALEKTKQNSNKETKNRWHPFKNKDGTHGEKRKSERERKGRERKEEKEERKGKA